MAHKCSALVDTYLYLLKTAFTVHETEDGCRIVTPFHRPDGEAIEVIAEKATNGHLRLTDEFLTADYLFLNGLDIEGNHELYDEAVRVARLCGVEFYSSELFIEVSAGDEATALHKLLDAIQALTYFIYRRAHREYRSFTEEVALFLAENEVTFSTEHILPGKTIEHTVPIFINGSRNLVLSPLSTTSLSNAKHRVKELAWTTQDIKAVQPTITFTAILDDRGAYEKVWADATVTKVLHSHTDHVLPWADRWQFLSRLR